jgi:photosystem I subunit II
MIGCRKYLYVEDFYNMAEEIKLSGKTPQFGGSTGGLLTKAEVEEKYAITWTSTKEQVFEMPTGGAAIMNQGENLLYLARKEQCLALGAQLRTKFKPKILDYKVYRIFPSGETQYLHPADGVFPEKVNEGREYNGKKDRRIGQNPQPATIKFSGKATYEV